MGGETVLVAARGGVTRLTLKRPDTMPSRLPCTLSWGP